MGQDLHIKTFVFLDLETSGLPYEEYNKTKITELCCMGVKTRDINSKQHPRVKQTINFCFYPDRLICSESEKLTGLSNELLEYEPRFKKQAGDVIGGFLDLLEKPVCFVAHNGDYFDYPILKAEMHKAGSQLNDDLLCIDSLKVFTQLYEEDAKAMVTSMNGSPEQESSSESLGADDLEKLEVLSRKRYDDAQMINETTPSHKIKTHAIDETAPKVIPAIIDHLYYTTDIAARKQDDVRKPNSAVPARKRLHFGKPSFKLADLYQRLTKKVPLEAHRAEEDVLMLIECALSLGQRFTDWANKNAVKLAAIPMMTPGRKIGT